MNDKREFFDEKKHRGINAFFKIRDKLNENNVNDAINQLKKLIQDDPDYLDPYLLLFEIFQEQGNLSECIKILDSAYERALQIITDKDGNWPDILEWGWLENRPIISTFLNKALFFWIENKTTEALQLLRKLLKTNPGDNIGARNFILAIRMGMDFERFQKKFDKGGFYDNTLTNWFYKNYKKFPDEFDWWDKAIEEIG